MGRETFAGGILEECNGCCSCREYYFLKRKMNEPAMVIQAALFTRDYNHRVVRVLTALIFFQEGTVTNPAI